MPTYETQEEIERRFRFYNSEAAEKYLKKNGVPKRKRDLKALVEVEYPDPDLNTIESICYVHFEEHPQQINIRDKANGKMILSLEK